MEVGAPGVTDELAADMAAAEKTTASGAPAAPTAPSVPEAPSPKAPVNQEGDR